MFANLIPIITAITTRAEALAMRTFVFGLADEYFLKEFNAVRKVARITALTTGVDAELAAVSAEKSSYATIIASLPVGNPVRVDLENKVVKLNFREFTLNQRKVTVGRIALLQANFDSTMATNVKMSLSDVQTAAQNKLNSLPA